MSTSISNCMSLLKPAGVRMPKFQYERVIAECKKLTDRSKPNPILKDGEAKVKKLVDAKTDLVILDSRPMPEFNNMSIPGGVDCPGAELVYRVKDFAPRSETLVVVNCAGRTRSIIEIGRAHV